MAIPPPALRALESHLTAAPYRSGERAGLWRLWKLDFPHAVFEIAAPARESGPELYAIRFDLACYPDSLTGAPWDATADIPLEPVRWPTGGRLSQIFNPGWRTDAVYMPMDHQALQGHDAWPTQHAGYLWNPDAGVVQYLSAVSDLLHSDEYAGVRGA